MSSLQNFISTHTIFLPSHPASTQLLNTRDTLRLIHPRNPRPYPRNYSVPLLSTTKNPEREKKKKKEKRKRKKNSSREKILLSPEAKIQGEREGRRKLTDCEKRRTSVSRLPEVGACRQDEDTFWWSQSDDDRDFNEGSCVQKLTRRPGWRDLKTVTGCRVGRANCRCTGWKWRGKRNRKGGKSVDADGKEEEVLEKKRREWEKERERSCLGVGRGLYGAVSMNCETCSRGIIGLGSSTMFDAEDRSQWIGSRTCNTPISRNWNRRSNWPYSIFLTFLSFFFRSLVNTVTVWCYSCSTLVWTSLFRFGIFGTFAITLYFIFDVLLMLLSRINFINKIVVFFF